MADNPSPMYNGTIPVGTFIFFSSVTAKIMITKSAVPKGMGKKIINIGVISDMVLACFLPNAWSYAKIHVLVMAGFGYDVNIPDAVPVDEFGKKASLLKRKYHHCIIISNNNFYIKSLYTYLMNL